MNMNDASGYRGARRRVGNHRGRGASPRGFTLIELMVVVAILAIVTSIAVASYGFATVKSRRGAAQGCLMEAAQFMERYYTTNLTYLGAAYPDLACSNELADYYNFSHVAAATATEYTLQAVPIGAQLSGDTKCGTMTLDQVGTKTESGSATDAGQCW